MGLSQVLGVLFCTHKSLTNEKEVFIGHLFLTPNYNHPPQ